VCKFVGQQWHRQTTRLVLYAQGHRVKGIKPLNEEEASSSGAELISEGFVLSVGLGALIVETNRSARVAAEKAAQKEQRRLAKLADIETRFKFLQSEFEDVSMVTKALYHHVESLEKKYKGAAVPLPPLPASLLRAPEDAIASQALKDHKAVEQQDSVLKQVGETVSVQGATHMSAFSLPPSLVLFSRVCPRRRRSETNARGSQLPWILVQWRRRRHWCRRTTGMTPRIQRTHMFYCCPPP